VHRRSAFLAFLLGVCVLLGAGTSAANPPSPYAEFDAKARAELEGIAPATLPTWDAANAARDAGRYAEAEAAYRAVRDAAPKFDHAHRRLCSSLAALHRVDEALVECRSAMSLRDSPENEAALASALVDGPSPSSAALIEAHGLVLRAQKTHPDDVAITSIAARVALARGDESSFDYNVATLRRIDPDGVETAFYSILQDLGHEDVDGARAELARHRTLFSPEQAAGIDAMIDDVASRPTPARVAWRVAKVFLLWGAAFALLFALGSLLSKATLRATKNVDPAAKGAAIGGTAWLKRLYGVLLAATSVFFYVSLPLIAVAVVGIGGAIVYGVLAMGYISLKLFAIVGVVVLASLWAMAKGVWALFRKAKDEDPGIPVDVATHAKLGAVLAEVSGKVGTRTVDRVFLTPGTAMAVFERGSALATWRGRGERCLVVGGALFSGFPIHAFKAVLAHEFGHFKNEDTAGGAFSLAARRSLQEMILALARGGAAGRFNPAWLFVEGYYKVFLRISHGASRLQEVLADRWAVTAYGSRSFAAGLRHVIVSDIRFGARVSHAVQSAADANTPLVNLYRLTEDPPGAEKVESDIDAALNREPGPYDSHPSPKDRLEAADAMGIELAAKDGSDDDVWSLFEDREALEKELMAVAKRNIEQNTGLVLPEESDAAA
jgi:Zn-dependent protease with chaperone function